MRTRALRFAAVSAAAFAGLLGAHALDYMMLERDPAMRARMLARSGHAWAVRAPEFAIASIVVAVLAALALGFLRGRGRAAPVTRSVRRTGLVLALIQGGAFVAVEAGERLASNAGANKLVAITVLGFGLQAVTASLAAIVLSLVARAGAYVARVTTTARRTTRRPAVSVWRPLVDARPHARFAGALGRTRAPPVLVH